GLEPTLRRSASRSPNVVPLSLEVTRFLAKWFTDGIKPLQNNNLKTYFQAGHQAVDSFPSRAVRSTKPSLQRRSLPDQIFTPAYDANPLGVIHVRCMHGLCARNPLEAGGRREVVSWGNAFPHLVERRGLRARSRGEVVSRPRV